MNKNRLEAFSDGMFAIIMTIMILDLKAPHGGNFKDLQTVLPALFCYLQSFLFVGVYWNNHHHLFHTVKKINGRIILINMAILFFLSLIPFVTAWVAETNFSRQAVVVYSVSLLLPGVTWMFLQNAIKETNQWSEEVTKIMQRQGTLKGGLSLIIYSAGIPFAYVNPYISEGLFLLVSVIWLVPNKQLEKVLGE